MEQKREGGGGGGLGLEGSTGYPSSVRDSGFDTVLDETQQLDNRAATAIQAFWRGYWAREHNTQVVSARKEIRARRAEDHIMLLRKDLEKNRKLYEEEKRLRILQMEAIKILYQEVQALKSQSSPATGTNDLSRGNSHQLQPFSPGSTALTLSGGHGSPLATTTMGSVGGQGYLGGSGGGTGTPLSSLGYTGYSAGGEMNRTHELERTCASLQSQVSQLQEALESVSSAVFRNNALDGPNLDYTDDSDTVQVTAYTDSQAGEFLPSEELSSWGCIPNSLSPYPSVEEEEYFQQVPVPGAPTPPRKLKLQHYSPSALLLSWQPSSCSSRRGEAVEEEEGNKHIIGYRVFVNDQLKAFVYQRTSALVEGLNSSMTYKFYVKALSGFGESCKSHTLMARLAKGGERYQKHRQASSGESAHDSDSEKDLDSTENNSEKIRKRNRKMRKSPRLGSAGEKRKPSGKTSSHRSQHHHSHHHYHHQSSSNQEEQQQHHMLMSPRSDSEVMFHLYSNTNNSAIATADELNAAAPVILRHPKLHTHKGGGSSSRGHNYHCASDTATTTSKEPSPVAGSGAVKATPTHHRVNAPTLVPPSLSSSSSPSPSAAAASTTIAPSAKENVAATAARKLPDSPSHESETQLLLFQAGHKQAAAGESGDRKCREAGAEKVDKLQYPSSGSSSRRESQTHHLRKGVAGSAPSSRQQSPQISPSSGTSDNPPAAKPMMKSQLQPASGETGSPSPGMVPVSVQGESQGESQRSSMSETFTVEKASSFLESVSAIAESVLGGRQGSRGGHRRTRSRDLQAERVVGLEKSESVAGGSSRHRERKPSGGSDGKLDLERKVSTGSDGKGDSETAGESKVKGHRRKRSKDLNNIAPTWDAEEPLKSEEGSSANPAGGRRRHSSGSRSGSPVMSAADGTAPVEEKTRKSVGEMMLEQQRNKLLNKSSSLNSLSGRSEDGSAASRYDPSSKRRSPSSESLPGSAVLDKGDNTSKQRNSSNESLQSGGGGSASSKRTHSNESLLSIRTDTSKQSHSNESLPGSARTESSRKSPSNESLPESIKEESTSEQHPAGQQQRHGSSGRSRSGLNPRRTQSFGSTYDIGRNRREQQPGSSGRNVRGNNPMSDLLQNLESIIKNNSTSVREKKEALMVKQPAGDPTGGEEGEGEPAGRQSDEERHRGRRSRTHSESDTEGGGVSDPGSQLPPRAPSESSSGSHSDDNRHHRRGHRRTPSDHRPTPPALPPDTDPVRPMHSPIIMEDKTRKTSGSGSNVLRNQSLHGILPSKHPDTKVSAASTEDISFKSEEPTPPASSSHQTEQSSRQRSHLRSRSPSPARARPVLSAAQLKRQGESSSGGKSSAHDQAS